MPKDLCDFIVIIMVVMTLGLFVWHMQILGGVLKPRSKPATQAESHEQANTKATSGKLPTRSPVYRAWSSIHVVCGRCGLVLAWANTIIGLVVFKHLHANQEGNAMRMQVHDVVYRSHGTICVFIPCHGMFILMNGPK